MILLIVSVEKASETAEASFSFAASAAGLVAAEQYDVSVVDLTTGQNEPLSRCGANNIIGTETVGARQIVAVEVATMSR